MEEMVSASICGGLAYLLGSVPAGLLIARARGVDIRRVGSGNIGATNVFRCVGKPWGVLTFAADALKGFIPAFLFPRAAVWAGGVATPGLGFLCAVLAVAGHNWPVFLGFRGGKGVATSTGALLGIAPAAVAVGLAVWAAVFLGTRYVSLASITAAMAVSAAGWIMYRAGGVLLPAVLTALGIVAVWRHRTNIRRLLAGTEHRFDLGKKNA